MKKSPWTIEKISIGLFAVLLPVVLLLGATNVVRIWQAYKTERHKTEEAFSAGIETLQGKLDKPERYIADFLTQASELQTLSSTVNEPDRYVAKNTVYENFGSYLAQNDSVLLLALYCEDTDIYIERDNGLRYLSIQGRAVLRNTLREEFPKNCKEAEASSRWCAVQAGEHVLLYRVMHLQKRYMLCCIDLSAWADAASHSVEAGSTILIRCDGTLQGSNAAQYAEVLADLTPDSSKLIRSGSLLAVSKPFYNAELIFLANNDIALRSSVLLSQISAVISIGCVLVAGILLFAWRKTILLPLRSLKKTMELIREGKLEERAVDANAGAELQEINDTFNQMMSNIHQLKIEGYTEILQISKQLHNLTRIHAQGYIEETVYQERRIRIEQQLAEKKKCLTCQKQNGTAEKALYQTKQIDRYMQNHTALTEFDEEAMRTIVKKIVVSNEAFVFELPNGLHLKEKR